MGGSPLGGALVWPGRELVIYGLSFFNHKTNGPTPVMDGPRTCHLWAKLFEPQTKRADSCNGRAWDVRGKTNIMTHDKPDNRATQTKQTQHTNKQNMTKLD